MRIFLIIIGLLVTLIAAVNKADGLVSYWSKFPRPTLTTRIVPVLGSVKLPASRVHISGSNFALGTTVASTIGEDNPIVFDGYNVLLGHNLLGGNVVLSTENVVSGQTLVNEESILPSGFTLADLPDALSIGGLGISHAAAAFNAIKDHAVMYFNVVLPTMSISSYAGSDLKTVTAAEGETISIDCPSGMSIHGWEAAYTAADLTAAPTCGVYATNSPQIAWSCVTSLPCSFTVSTEILEIPDPCPDIEKALTINYLCRYDYGTN